MVGRCGRCGETRDLLWAIDPRDGRPTWVCGVCEELWSRLPGRQEVSPEEYKRKVRAGVTAT